MVILASSEKNSGNIYRVRIVKEEFEPFDKKY